MAQEMKPMTLVATQATLVCVGGEGWPGEVAGGADAEGKTSDRERYTPVDDFDHRVLKYLLSRHSTCQPVLRTAFHATQSTQLQYPKLNFPPILGALST